MEQINIPISLKNNDLNFVLIEKNGKKPFQFEWQKKTIKYDDKELIQHLQNGGNYGVLGGGNKNLVIVDFDNVEIQKKIIPLLPKTFTVKTGSGMLHKYFFSDKSESFKIFDGDFMTSVDVQGKGKQVVAPNSVHPNGNKYEIIDNSPIAFISYSELKAIILPHDKKPKSKKKSYVADTSNYSNDNLLLDLLISSIKIENVLEKFGVDVSKNPTNCPLHDSKGGKCLGFTDNVAHCFHCENSWNIFSAVKDFKKVDFKESLEWICSEFGFEKNLEESRKLFLEEQQKNKINREKDLLLAYLSYLSERPKNWDDASEMLVNEIKKENHIYTTRSDEKSEIWFYDGGVYKPHGRTYIKEILRKILGKHFTSYIYSLVLNKIESDTYIDSEYFYRNRYIEEIPVKNGILNIVTRELTPFTPNKIFFNKIPVIYDPSKDCEQIDNFLKTVLKDEDDVNVIYELIGFSLLSEYRYEKAFMLVGNGRNGKGKTIDLIKRFLGASNCSAIPLSLLYPESFTVSELFGKRINLAGDIGSKDLKETSTFKGLTGRDLITGKRKWLPNIEFENYAKLVFACNELPMVYDISRGFWERWILLEFPNTFVSEKEYENSEDKANLKIRDENIISKITSDDEFSGLLNKSLDGFDRLRKNKDFSVTKGTKEIKDIWIRKANSFTAFCMDFIEESYDSYITKKELRRAYTKYCKRHKVSGKNDMVVKRVLQEMFGVYEERKNVFGVYDDFERVWTGIKFKEK